MPTATKSKVNFSMVHNEEAPHQDHKAWICGGCGKHSRRLKKLRHKTGCALK